MPWLVRAGLIWSAKTAACLLASRPASVRVFFSSCSGVQPMAFWTGKPAAIRRTRPAILTWKNSSRLEAKMARKRTRSSRGIWSSSASSRTRWLNWTQLYSRSRYRSAGRS